MNPEVNEHHWKLSILRLLDVTATQWPGYTHFVLKQETRGTFEVFVLVDGLFNVHLGFPISSDYQVAICHHIQYLIIK